MKSAATPKEIPVKIPESAVVSAKEIFVEAYKAAAHEWVKNVLGEVEQIWERINDDNNMDSYLDDVFDENDVCK